MAGEFAVDAPTDQSVLDVVSESLPAQLLHSHTERRLWLDTHDWSLFRAGLLLEQRTGGGQQCLVLTQLDGAPIYRAPVGRRTVTARTLPDGPIRGRVAGPIGIRALLPKLSAEGPTSLLAVLDDLDKTVARVVIEGPWAADGVAPRVVRVRVEPLRGYEKQGRKIAAQLGALSGLTPVQTSVFAALALAAGVEPGRHKSKPTGSFRAETPAGEAFAETFAELLEIVRDNLDGTLRELDTEFLHDLRVAVRRSRSVLKVAEGILDEPTRQRYAGELKWLADATSLSRDLDVYLLGFGEVAEAGPAEPFRRLVERRCRRAHAALNRVLRSDRCAALLAGWGHDLARTTTGGPLATTAIAEVAHNLLSRAWRRVAKRGRAIRVDSPAEALHDLRKRCKELRYLLEFFASLYDQRAHRRIVDELKRLQDNLGEFQDAESHRLLVRSCAEELRGGAAPIETLLTMGRIENDLRLRQEAAHAAFSDRWNRFDARTNRKQFAAMVSAS